MKTLYLLRHADTTPAVPPLMGDHERILSARGVQDALALGALMQENGMYPDFVLSSSSVRTIQTARLIFGALFRKEGVRIKSHFSRTLYQAPAGKILAEIQDIDSSIGALMVVGHNWGIAELATALNESAPHPQLENYPPGTLAVFKSDCENWADFSPETTKLEKVFQPQTQ